LDAAAELIADEGYDALTTRTVAERTGIPIATLYRYFSDKDDLIAALVEQHVTAMDGRAAAVAADPHASLQDIVAATFAAHVEYFEQNPSWVALWFRGRRSPAVDTVVHERNARLAILLRSVGLVRGLIVDDTPEVAIQVAIEACDRVYELAYRIDPRGDRSVLDAGLELVAGYVQRFAAVPEGRR
jgi:AcrR family transcriptional regulator